MHNYIFSKFEWNGYFGVLIGNKNCLRQAVEAHKADFESVLGFPITEDMILAALEQGQGHIFERIFSHDALLGILLGFGKENSWSFHIADKKLQSFSKPNLIWEIWVKRSKRSCRNLQPI